MRVGMVLAVAGTGYVAVLLLLAGLVALAWLGTGRARHMAGLVAPVVGFIAAALAITTVQGMTGTGTAAALGLGQVRAAVNWASGGWFAVAAAALLGFAGACSRWPAPTGEGPLDPCPAPGLCSEPRMAYVGCRTW
jgi:hypothetical protein